MCCLFPMPTNRLSAFNQKRCILYVKTAIAAALRLSKFTENQSSTNKFIANVSGLLCVLKATPNEEHFDCKFWLKPKGNSSSHETSLWYLKLSLIIIHIVNSRKVVNLLSTFRDFWHLKAMQNQQNNECESSSGISIERFGSYEFC